MKPSPSTRDRTPRVSATVRDNSTELAKGDIRFVLDGRARSTFAYYPGADRLIYDSGRLPVGRHTVRITATDEAGNTSTRTWSFKVITG